MKITINNSGIIPIFKIYIDHNSKYNVKLYYNNILCKHYIVQKTYILYIILVLHL